MITFSKIGKKGNLGNQLFQIASTIGLAVENNTEFAFYKWKYQSYFKNELPLLSDDVSNFLAVEEKEYNFHQWSLDKENYDINGWLQTEKYFDTKRTKHYFQFSDSLISTVRQLYQKAFEKRTILISIRRGDFVNHKDYFQLPIKYYLNALAQFFPDWDTYNLIILSDDINYCKFHFSFLENAFFGDGLNEMEQLCLGTLCNDFIISNSTFSWWTAWLGEKNDSKIIRPLKNFDGQKSIELNDLDYYPERWTKYNHLDVKVHLTNLVFRIQTKRNIVEVERYLTNYFDAEFSADESDSQSYESFYIIKQDCFIPPILIYSSWLKFQKENLDIVINEPVKLFKVSKRFNYPEFTIQNDFGLFSKIFSFSSKFKQTGKSSYVIYLKRNNNIDLEENHADRELIIYFLGGRFLNTGGYKLNIKRFIKAKEIYLKRSVKKILSIK